jgi:hypothetical protein
MVREKQGGRARPLARAVPTRRVGAKAALWRPSPREPGPARGQRLRSSYGRASGRGRASRLSAALAAPPLGTCARGPAAARASLNPLPLAFSSSLHSQDQSAPGRRARGAGREEACRAPPDAGRTGSRDGAQTRGEKGTRERRDGWARGCARAAGGRRAGSRRRPTPLPPLPDLSSLLPPPSPPPPPNRPAAWPRPPPRQKRGARGGRGGRRETGARRPSSSLLSGRRQEAGRRARARAQGAGQGKGGERREGSRGEGAARAPSPCPPFPSLPASSQARPAPGGDDPARRAGRGAGLDGHAPLARAGGRAAGVGGGQGAVARRRLLQGQCAVWRRGGG